MTRPDRELIAQVMLFSQGFRTAESLASKIVPFFNLCDEQLSPQPHYDFGLRALKAVLASAGILKRERLLSAQSEDDGVGGLSDTVAEQVILIQSVTETIVPKLVADDVPLLTRYVSALYFAVFVSDVFLVYSRTSSQGRSTSPSTSMPFVRRSGRSVKRGDSYRASDGFPRFCSCTRSRRFSTV